MTKRLFLPGAGGSAEFWAGVVDLLPETWSTKRFAWPGLGNEPAHPDINDMDDLVTLVCGEIDAPVDLIAQSMGGVVAARIAIERPEVVRRLVLTATSAGLDMKALGASQWRDNYVRNFPNAAHWITASAAAAPLPVERIQVPTLLIWGDADPISPVAVGKELERRLPHARLEVVAGGDHDMALAQTELLADMIKAYLS